MPEFTNTPESTNANDEGRRNGTPSTQDARVANPPGETPPEDKTASPEKPKQKDGRRRPISAPGAQPGNNRRPAARGARRPNAGRPSGGAQRPEMDFSHIMRNVLLWA